MTAHIVFITAGEYSDRQTVPLVVCCDEQVAEAVKAEAEAEIKRLEAVAAVNDTSCAFALDNGVLMFDTWDANAEAVRGVLATPRLDGFHWYPARQDRACYGGEVEIVIVEVPTIGPVA